MLCFLNYFQNFIEVILPIFFINNLKNNKNIIEIHKNNLLLLKSYDEESTNEVSDILNENRMEDQVHQYKEKVLNIVSN